MIVLSETFNVKELIPLGAKLIIPVPSHALISLFNMVKSRFEKSWFIAIPFDAFPISAMVLLLIVMLPAEVNAALITAIPLSPHDEIVLSVASSVKVLTGVPRTRAEPPILDMVFEDAVMSRVVNAPDVCR